MKIKHLPSTYPNLATVASVINMAADSEETMAIAAVYVPASFPATTMTFKGSHDGNTYYDVLKDDGTAYTATIAAGKASSLDIAKLSGYAYLKPIPGTASDGDYTLIFAARKV